jgi:type IV secretion system protein VirB10
MILLTRGPDAVLAKGTTLEMVLERPLQFDEPEIDFSSSMPRPSNSGGGPLPSRKANSRLGLPGTRSPVPPM